MKLVSFAINAVFHWLTNNSVQKPKRFIAAIVMTHNLHRDAMAVAPYFVRVRIFPFNLHNFIVFDACVYFSFIGVSNACMILYVTLVDYYGMD